MHRISRKWNVLVTPTWGSTIACAATNFLIAGSVAAASTITQNATDTSGQSSFTNGTHFPGGAPVSGNDYVDPQYTIRTVDSNASPTFTGASLTIGNGTAFSAGGGAPTAILALKSATGNTTTVNSLILAGGAIGQATNNSTQTVAGNILLNVGGGYLDLSSNGASGADARVLNITSLVSGSGGLAVRGTQTSNGSVGTAKFTGTNTYSGGTYVLGGNKLILGAGNVITSGAITSSAIGTGTLNLGYGTATASDSNLTGASLLDDGSARTVVNNVVIGGNGAITLASTSTGSLSFDGTALTTPSTVSLAVDTVLTVSTTTSIKDVITGNHSFTKAGSSTITLSGVNSYTGLTSINAGKLIVASGGRLGTGTSAGVTVGSQGVLELSTSSGIDDAATLTIATAAAPNAILDAGVNERVGTLVLGNTTYKSGTFGATGSGAQNINNTYFSGTGIITVPEPASIAVVACTGMALLMRRRRTAQ